MSASASALPLAVIDVQPGYNDHISRGLKSSLVAEIRARLNAGLPVFIVYNDEDMTGDTRTSVYCFWYDEGLTEEELDQCQFIEKQFAELRGWMDEGVDEDEIVAAVKLMRSRGVYDSRQLDEDDLAEVSQEGFGTQNPLFISQYLEASALFGVRKLDICGGGRNECLREVELWMDSLGTNYNRLDHLCYGA